VVGRLSGRRLQEFWRDPVPPRALNRSFAQRKLKAKARSGTN
jgi:hypothetical protein